MSYNRQFDQTKTLLVAAAFVALLYLIAYLTYRSL
jgi:hypothetical protein